MIYQPTPHQSTEPMFAQLGLPPYSMRIIRVPREAPQQIFPFDAELSSDEVTGEVFLGQLSPLVTEERIRSLIVAISNEILQVPMFVGTAVLHRRGGVCAFVTVNSSAVPLLLGLRHSFVLEDFCDIAWFAETDQQRALLASYFAARATWPRKAIVFESRVAPSPPKLIKELIREASSVKPTMGIKINMPPGLFMAPPGAFQSYLTPMQQPSVPTFISMPPHQQQQLSYYPQPVSGMQLAPSQPFFVSMNPQLGQLQQPQQLQIPSLQPMPIAPFACGSCQNQMEVVQLHPTSALGCAVCHAPLISAWGCRRCSSIVTRCLEHASL